MGYINLYSTYIEKGLLALLSYVCYVSHLFVLFLQVSTAFSVKCLWSCLRPWWEWGMVCLFLPPRTMNRIKDFRRLRKILRLYPKSSASFLTAARSDLECTTSSESSCKWDNTRRMNVGFYSESVLFKVYKLLLMYSFLFLRYFDIWCV